MSSQMRHRSVYVDTASRPASSPPIGPIKKDEPQQASTFPISLIAIFLSICLIAWGASVAIGSERASIHSQLTRDYRGFLESWEDHLTLMQSFKMRLKIGDAREVDLSIITMPTKRVVISANDSSTHALTREGQSGKKKRVVSSSHLEFAAAFHLSMPQSSDQVPLIVKSDGQLAEEGVVKNLLKRNVVRQHPSAELKKEIQSYGKDIQHLLTMEMLESVPLSLVISAAVPSSFSGESSKHELEHEIVIELGSHPFAKVSGVEARSRRDCVSNFWGHWNNEEE